MRLIIQRVNQASVKVVKTGQIAGKIEKGLFVLVGVKKGDTLKQAENLANKLTKLRIMADENEKMNLSVGNAGGKILAVSQFTLYATTQGGNRPSFLQAEIPQQAEKIYNHFVMTLRNLGIQVETGSFGDYMKIKANLDGPVTIILES